MSEPLLSYRVFVKFLIDWFADQEVRDMLTAQDLIERLPVSELTQEEQIACEALIKQYEKAPSKLEEAVEALDEAQQKIIVQLLAVHSVYPKPAAFAARKLLGWPAKHSPKD